MSETHQEPYQIDPAREKLIPLGEAHRHLPEKGKPKLVYRRLWPWSDQGCLNAELTRRVYLPIMKRGGRLFTSREAYGWFIQQQNQP